MKSLHNHIPKGYSDSSLSESFNRWLPELFLRKSVFDRSDLDPSNKEMMSSYLERHLYLVSMNLRGGIGIVSDSKAPIKSGFLFDSIYKGWYLSVCKRLLGRRYNKKFDRQPFTVAFLDVEGTRYFSAPSTFQMPHIHSLMLVHPSSASRFELLSKSEQFTKITDTRIADIDIRQFRDDGRFIGPMMTYAAKFTRQTLTNGRPDKTWSAYPDVQSLHYPFYRILDGEQGIQTA
jgi:hypothetical protein